MWVFFPTMSWLGLYCCIWGPQHWGELGVGLELTKAWDNQNISFSCVHVMHTVCVCICMWRPEDNFHVLSYCIRQILYWSEVHQIGYASCPLSARELPPLPPEHLGYHSMLPFFTQVLGMKLRSSCLQGLGPIGTAKNKVNSNKTNKQKSNPHSNFWVLFILKSKPILLSYWVYPYFFCVCSYLRINCCILWLSN